MSRRKKFDPIASAIDHTPIALSADALRILTTAATAASEAFKDGSPTPDTAEALIRASVGVGMGLVPTNISKELRTAVEVGLVAALGGLWRSLQVKSVRVRSKSAIDVTVEK